MVVSIPTWNLVEMGKVNDRQRWVLSLFCALSCEYPRWKCDSAKPYNVVEGFKFFCMFTNHSGLRSHINIYR